MDSVVTLSLNTALDKTLVLRHLRPEMRHAPERALTLAGGKAVNAARALRLLGIRARVVGLVAGRTGAQIEALLRDEGVPTRWVRLPRGESRTCITLVHGRAPTEVNEEGPRVPPEALRELGRLFLDGLKGCRFALLCGRIPPGVPAGFYAGLIRAAAIRGVPCGLDASEPALRPALTERPEIVKPNRAEMAELGLPTDHRYWRSSLDRLLRMGAREAWVTLGEDGALLGSGGEYLHAVSPMVREGCPIGCGDTFLAGTVYGRLKGWEARRRLAFATALASASARTLGAGLFLKAHLRETLARVWVREV
jgi:tagatose 6-phosphate kinase